MFGSIGTAWAPAAVPNATTSVAWLDVVVKLTDAVPSTGSAPMVQTKSALPVCSVIEQLVAPPAATDSPSPKKLPVSSTFSPGAGPWFAAVNVHCSWSLGRPVSGVTPIVRPIFARSRADTVRSNVSLTNAPEGSWAVTVTV